LKDSRAPNQKNSWNDLRSLSPKLIQCRTCGERVILHGPKVYHYPSWDPHNCEAKVKIYTKEEIEALNEARKKSEGDS
jgi:hypothetical protein